MLYALVVGQPFLDRCIAFREQYLISRDAIEAYVISIGGNEYRANCTQGLTHVRFVQNKGEPRRIPLGWSAPDARSRMSYPLVGSRGAKTVAAVEEILEKIKAIPPLPNPFEVYEGIPLQMDYTYKSGKGSASLLHRPYPTVEWVEVDGESNFILHIPDIEKAKALYMDVTFDDVITNWKIPEGLRVISSARRELLWATSKVQEEEEAERNGEK